jgi:hypothetical protein
MVDKVPTKTESTPCISLIPILRPSHGLGVGDLSEVTLGCRKIGMPQDHLADNFDGNARVRGIGGGVTAEIVWPEGNADHLTGLDHHHPGSLIGNRENPVFPGLAAFDGVFPEPVGNLTVTLSLVG